MQILVFLPKVVWPWVASIFIVYDLKNFFRIWSKVEWKWQSNRFLFHTSPFLELKVSCSEMSSNKLGVHSCISCIINSSVIRINFFTLCSFGGASSSQVVTFNTEQSEKQISDDIVSNSENCWNFEHIWVSLAFLAQSVKRG